MSLPDKFYPILLVLAASALVYLGRIGQFELRFLYYIGAIILCTVIAYWVQYQRLRPKHKQKMWKFNGKQVGLMFINLAIIVIPSAIFRNNGGSWDMMFEQFLVAFWETGTFGITVPFGFILLTRFARKNTIMETGFFAVILAISTACFMLAHIKAYGLDPFKLSFLYVFGFGFNFITYAFNPSLGIGLHYLNNIIVFNKFLTT
jgi:hypothetical protein